MSSSEAQHANWSPQLNLSRVGQNVRGARLATDAAGNSIAIWVREGENGNLDAVDWARYDASNRTWTSAATLAEWTGLVCCHYADIAMNPAGDAVAIWTIGHADLNVHTARYSASTGQWSVPEPLTFSGGAFAPAVAINDSGDAVAAWEFARPTGSVVQASRYSAAFGTWGPVDTLSSEATRQGLGLTAAAGIDSAGNALVTWAQPSAATRVFQASAYRVASGAWSDPHSLGAGGLWADGPRLSTSADGISVAIWPELQGTNHVIRAARHDAASGLWSRSLTLSASSTNLFGFSTSLDHDSSGNVVAAWSRYLEPTGSVVEAVRFSRASGTWSSAETLFTSGFDVFDLHVDVDASGNAAVLWETGNPSHALGSSFSPALSGIWTGPTLFANTTASPYSMEPRIAFSSLGRVVAIWTAYVGTETGGPVYASEAIAPAPTVLHPAAVAESRVTLRWTPSNPAASEYNIIASLATDGPIVATLPVGAGTSTTVRAPIGTYYVRVLSRIQGTWFRSNEIEVVVGTARPPAPPTRLTASVAGSTVTLTWAGVAGASSYLIEAGSAPGRTDLARLNTGNALPTFISPPVPDGSYFARVRAVNAAGVSGPSATVRATVGPPPPGPPTLTGSVTDPGAVSLSWTPPATGPEVTGYQLHAGTSPGASNAATLNLPVVQVSFAAAGVPAGTYYVRVIAMSGIGPGFDSNEVVLVVP